MARVDEKISTQRYDSNFIGLWENKKRTDDYNSLIMLQEKLQEIGNQNRCPIALIVKEGRILTGHRHYTKDKWKEISVWTIPGGRCDEGEVLEKALRREVCEEVGISDLQIIDFIGEVSGAKEGDSVPVFFCTTKQSPKLMEPEKFSEWRWVTKEEWFEDKKYSGFNSDARKMMEDYLSTHI